jgi:hypothetical protein
VAGLDPTTFQALVSANGDPESACRRAYRQRDGAGG